MIHIATVHWNTDRWIRPQLAFFSRFIRQPYRVYAWINHVPDAPLGLFHYACTEMVESHPIKLNLLADVISASADEDDVIVFIDGDAFPVAPLDPLLEEELPRHSLLAVKRLENNGDLQPHPCFCATTVRFWKKIKGDWKSGFEWNDRYGRPVTDVGGNLLQQLNEHEVDWYPLLRSNQVNLHPLFFGIYGDIIYHHNAGFRPGLTRFDYVRVTREFWNRTLLRLPGLGRRYGRKLMRDIASENDALSEQVFKRIQADPDFYTYFAKTGSFTSWPSGGPHGGKGPCSSDP